MKLLFPILNFFQINNSLNEIIISYVELIRFKLMNSLIRISNEIKKDFFWNNQ